MSTEFKWKKKVFSNCYRIFKNTEQIGEIREKVFSRKVTATIHNKSYYFQTNGFFKQQTEIIDETENRVIGEIEYGTWNNKATINLDGEVFYWKYNNSWITKWSLCNEKGAQLNFKGSYSDGEIQTNSENELLLLTGLYITNYFWQTTMLICLAAMIPIFLN